MSDDARGGLASRLVRWQRRHGRHDLPWQRPDAAGRPPDAYRVWLSEIMLQQTQVATVVRYFDRFVARLPDVRALAAASPDEVAALWSGLGYYRRAHLAHACARTVVAEHGGVFPTDAATLETLPGIGRSTAAAIAAFVAGERVAILDGNVKRVLARLHAVDGDPKAPAVERRLWAIAESMLPAGRGARRDMPAYTQGLMDLGATVCTPRAPACLVCPWRPDCRALASGRPEAWPQRARRAKRHARADALLWLEHRGRVWLQRRPDAGVWARLWSFPEFADADALAAALAPLPGAGGWLAPLVHVLTHRDWTLQPLRWTLPDAFGDAQADAALVSVVGAGAAAAGRWFERADALAAGLPAPLRRWLDGTPG